MILADPSELRFGSRLPDVLRRECRKCEQLEERTGADLVVSGLNLPFGSYTLLARHLQEGVAIQRKTGSDLAASVTDGRLYASLQKMVEWTERRWLAVIGELEENGMNLDAIVGALDWWQLRGGYVTLLRNDRAFVEWVRSWPKRLQVLETKKQKVVLRNPQQELVVDPRKVTLVSLPGVGPERAEALLEESGSLAKALSMVAGQGGTGVRGVGKGVVEGVRKHLGLAEGEKLVVGSEAMGQELLARLSDVMWEEQPQVLVPLYAELAGWMGLPCSGDMSWQEWTEEALSDKSGQEV